MKVLILGGVVLMRSTWESGEMSRASGPVRKQYMSDTRQLLC